MTERRAQLRTVLWMRLFAVCTLCSLLGLAHGMEVVRLPWPTLLFVLGMLMLLNVLAWLRLRGGVFGPQPAGSHNVGSHLVGSHHVGPYEVGAQIFADLFGFSVLLYYTGGATNPFVMFYLPLLGLAAAFLPWVQVLALAGFSIVAYSVLMLEYIPLVLSKPQNAVELHLLGMWINFLVSVAILVGFVARLSNGIRQRDQDLNTAQTRLSRDARMAALGNQSASLAHELGTPLSTAKIILSDWMDNPDGLEPQVLQRDVQVLQEQLSRMEGCLIRLRGSLEFEGDGGSLKPLIVKTWLNDWLAAWRNRNPQAKLVCNVAFADSLRASAQWDSVELVLNGLFENALQAYERALASGGVAQRYSERCIDLSVRCTKNALEFVVEDKAGGFDKDLLTRLGREPLGAMGSSKNTQADNRRGMGLFLAVGLIERVGGLMQFSQVLEEGGIADPRVVDSPVVGARVDFSIPLGEVTQ